MKKTNVQLAIPETTGPDLIKRLLPAQAFRKLASLYADMQTQYSAYAQTMGLTCDNCPQNCCTSFFQHHTRIEWAFLLHGLAELPPERRAAYESRARDYVRDSKAALAKGERPGIMCPLNDDGRCGVYAHRLMICRLHGVPNRLRYPNGRVVDFRVASAARSSALVRTPSRSWTAQHSTLGSWNWRCNSSVPDKSAPCPGLI
jgi:hypothetical protein